MSNRQLILVSFGHALGVLVYTSAVAWIILNGQRIFAGPGSFWGPLSFLLLFVLSATVVGLLVLGRPGYLYFNREKKTGIVLLLCTVGWLFVFTIGVFLARLVSE